MAKDLTKAKKYVSDFVMTSPFEIEWKHLILALIEPLDIMDVDAGVLCNDAQTALRNEWPESYSNKAVWQSRTGPWTRDAGVLRILEIVQKTALRLRQ